MDITDYIFEQQHPYYLQGICATDISYRNYCSENKYRILKKWSKLSLTVEELHFRLPYASFPDIVELCLLYYPINESSKYYDGITLFSHACEWKMDNSFSFLTNWIDSLFKLENSKYWATISNLISEFVHIICLICYKYKYTKPLHDLIESDKFYLSNYHYKQLANIIILCIQATHGSRMKSKIVMTSLLVNYMLRMGIFAPEEIAEFIIICSLLFITDQLMNDILLGLEGDETVTNSTYTNIGRFINNKSDIRLLNKYGSDYGLPIIIKKVTKYSENIDFTTVLDIPNKVNFNLLSDVDLYKFRQAIFPYLKEPDRMSCYLTSGDFISYIDLRSRGYKLEFPIIYSINSLGFHSLNRDMLKLLNYDIDKIVDILRLFPVDFRPKYYPSKEDKLREQILKMDIPGKSIGSKLKLIETILAGSRLIVKIEDESTDNP